MTIELNGRIYHDEHDITVKVSNDNQKGEKRVTVTLRSDGEPKDVIKLARELYEDALK